MWNTSEREVHLEYKWSWVCLSLVYTFSSSDESELDAFWRVWLQANLCTDSALPWSLVPPLSWLSFHNGKSVAVLWRQLAAITTTFLADLWAEPLLLDRRKISRESHWFLLRREGVCVAGMESGWSGGDGLPGGGDGTGSALLGTGGLSVTSLQTGGTGAPSISGGWNPSNHGNTSPRDQPKAFLDF